MNKQSTGSPVPPTPVTAPTPTPAPQVTGSLADLAKNPPSTADLVSAGHATNANNKMWGLAMAALGAGGLLGGGLLASRQLSEGDPMEDDISKARALIDKRKRVLTGLRKQASPQVVNPNVSGGPAGSILGGLMGGGTGASFSDIAPTVATGALAGAPLLLAAMMYRQSLKDTYKPETSDERYKKLKTDYNTLLLNDKTAEARFPCLTGFLRAIDDAHVAQGDIDQHENLEKSAFIQNLFTWPGYATLFGAPGMYMFYKTLQNLRKFDEDKMKGDAATEAMNRWKGNRPPKLHAALVNSQDEADTLNELDDNDENLVPVVGSTKAADVQPQYDPVAAKRFLQSPGFNDWGQKAMAAKPTRNWYESLGEAVGIGSGAQSYGAEVVAKLKAAGVEGIETPEQALSFIQNASRTPEGMAKLNQMLPGALEELRARDPQLLEGTGLYGPDGKAPAPGAPRDANGKIVYTTPDNYQNQPGAPVQPQAPEQPGFLSQMGNISTPQALIAALLAGGGMMSGHGGLGGIGALLALFGPQLLKYFQNQNASPKTQAPATVPQGQEQQAITPTPPQQQGAVDQVAAQRNEAEQTALAQDGGGALTAEDKQLMDQQRQAYEQSKATQQPAPQPQAQPQPLPPVRWDPRAQAPTTAPVQQPQVAGATQPAPAVSPAATAPHANQQLAAKPQQQTQPQRQVASKPVPKPASPATPAPKVSPQLPQLASGTKPLPLPGVKPIEPVKTAAHKIASAILQNRIAPPATSPRPLGQLQTGSPGRANKIAPTAPARKETFDITSTKVNASDQVKRSGGTLAVKG